MARSSKCSRPANNDTIPLANKRFDFFHRCVADNLAELSHCFVPKENANDTPKVREAVPEMDLCNKSVSSFERVSAGICLSDSHHQLSKWLCNFVRKQNGEQHPPDYPALPR